MNQKEARGHGYDNGAHCAWMNVAPEKTDEQLEGIALEAEDNARQYSPFEFFAHDANATGDRAEGIWEAYDAGVLAGIRAVIRKYRSQQRAS